MLDPGSRARGALGCAHCVAAPPRAAVARGGRGRRHRSCVQHLHFRCSQPHAAAAARRGRCGAATAGVGAPHVAARPPRAVLLQSRDTRDAHARPRAGGCPRRNHGFCGRGAGTQQSRCCGGHARISGCCCGHARFGLCCAQQPIANHRQRRSYPRAAPRRLGAAHEQALARAVLLPRCIAPSVAARPRRPRCRGGDDTVSTVRSLAAASVRGVSAFATPRVGAHAAPRAGSAVAESPGGGLFPLAARIRACAPVLRAPLRRQRRRCNYHA